MKKNIWMFALLLLSLTCKSQVRDGDNVIMPIDVYHGYRTTILECDTLQQKANKMEAEADSVIKAQDQLVKSKEAIIENKDLQLKTKDEIIEILKKPKHRIHPQLWLGMGGGMLLMVLLLR